MPTTSKVDSVVPATGLDRGGAGEPIGEPAPPPGILEGVPDDLGRQLPDEVVDELLAGARTEEEIVGPGGLLSRLTRRLVERALEVELTDHLGYEPHEEPPGGVGNTRNGSTAKTLLTEHGEVRIETPRDRWGRSSRRSCGSGSGASRGSTTRSSRCTAAASRRGTSKRTWRRSTGSRSAAT